MQDIEPVRRGQRSPRLWSNHPDAALLEKPAAGGKSRVMAAVEMLAFMCVSWEISTAIFLHARERSRYPGQNRALLRSGQVDARQFSPRVPSDLAEARELFFGPRRHQFQRGSHGWKNVKCGRTSGNH